MRRVHPAEPFGYGRMSSHGDARGMYIRQSRFPDTYDPEAGDRVAGADDDRIRSWHGHDHWVACLKKHMPKGADLQGWFMRGRREVLLAFIVDVNKLEEDVKWTGFRITGTVNRGNGYPIYSLELFVKGPKSRTKVYGTESAPNVEGHRSFQSRGY